MDTRRRFLQIITTLTASSLTADWAFAQTNRDRTEIGNPFKLPEEMVVWMKEATLEQLKGCRVEAHDGTWIHSPDGVGNYKALWTRDFYYMVENAGDLIDQEEIKASIQYLINGQRDDGCMPDRVYASGEAVYSPGAIGKPLADHAVDNGPFMAMLLCSYVNQFDDKELFLKLEPKVRNGLDQIFVKENGLVFNDPKNPQCVYGFTDIVKKTGYLLFTSLLFYKANLEMYKLCQKYGFNESSYYKRSYEYVKQSIYKLWSEEDGMFWAADIDCKQIDIWGSAYAIEVGVTNPEQTRRIAKFLVEHYDEYVQRGQIRHLANNDGVWEKLFIDYEPGTYQNGAYWATPLAWIVPIYDKIKPGLSKHTLEVCIEDFQKNGINECVNGEYLKVPNFVASATNVYALTK